MTSAELAGASGTSVGDDCPSKSMRPVAAFLLISVLASCATPDQRAEQTANYINANYGPLCEKLGYVPGSDPYRNCMVSMFNTDQVQMTPWHGPWGWRR